MRFVTYRSGNSSRVGVVDNDSILGASPETTLQALLDLEDDLAAAGERIIAQPYQNVPLSETVLEAPIPRPRSVRDFYAFEEHAINARRSRGGELPSVWYEMPVFYFSNPAAITGPRDPVPVAPGSTKWDYELEVAAVVGKHGSDLTPSEGEASIAGYCILGDFSARDLQQAEMTLGLGPAKGKDTATSLGPWLVTPDELEPTRKGTTFDLKMTATVNGSPYSSGSLASANWSFGQMLAYASRGTTVVPGDVIGSGTVGSGCILELAELHGASEYPWLEPGDIVRMEVERLGYLEHEIVHSSLEQPRPLA